MIHMDNLLIDTSSRGGHCINYVLVFALFTIILLLACAGTLPLRPTTGPQKLKQANFSQFSIYQIET